MQLPKRGWPLSEERQPSHHSPEYWRRTADLDFPGRRYAMGQLLLRGVLLVLVFAVTVSKVEVFARV
jgi:hypothetical protein